MLKAPLCYDIAMNEAGLFPKSVVEKRMRKPEQPVGYLWIRSYVTEGADDVQLPKRRLLSPTGSGTYYPSWRS